MPARVQDDVVVHLFYLHGFASSPESGKAARLRERLATLGLPLHAPDFNQPDFSSLTVSRMLAQLRTAITALPPGPVGLIGSSLGGFVAIHAAAGQAVGGPNPIARMVLLAPAVDFASGRDDSMTAEEIEEWRRTGQWDFFHYVQGRTLPVGYALYEDGHRFDAFDARFDVPTVVIQGTRDTVVQPARVVEWASSRDNVTLRLVEDDHQLQAHAETIWEESARSFGLAGA